MSTAAPLLSEDLIVEILSWLPVNALLRFRSVSKAWNSLIFNPKFVKLHFQRSQKNTHLLISFFRNGVPMLTREDMHEFVTPCAITRLLENPSSTIDDGSHPINFDYSVMGVCKGLVCSISSFSPIGNEFEEHWVRFFNPATRVISQESPRLRLTSSNYEIGLFEAKFGFGYDDSSDTCKVVAMLSDIKLKQREVRVFNLGDSVWRTTLTCPSFPVLGFHGLFVSGTVNWLSFCSSDWSPCYGWRNVTTINQLVIFSYDLKNDSYKYLLKPAGLVEVPCWEPYLGVLKGCLCLSYNHGGTHYVVWLMREFGHDKSWTQLLNVSYDHLQIQEPPVMLPLCISENEDVLLVIHGFVSFILYNKRENRMDSTGDFIDKQLVFFYDYVPTLTLPY